MAVPCILGAKECRKSNYSCETEEDFSVQLDCSVWQIMALKE